MFCCPACRGALRGDPQALRCVGCGQQYGSIAQIPLLVEAADHAAVDLRSAGTSLPTYNSPWIAAAEIARVLRPQGRAYTLCAFMQPLHGYPDHYFNATEAGLRRLFTDDFAIESCGPSRFCTHRQTAVPMYRMREMAQAFRGGATLDARTQWRTRRLERALMVASHQFQQLAERMLEVPASYELWRQIVPAVEAVAVRK